VERITKLSIFTFAAAAILLLPACSVVNGSSYLTSTPQVSETTLMTDYTNVSQGASSYVDSSVAQALNGSSATEMFFVTNDANRPTESVFAISDMGFVNSSWSGEPVEQVDSEIGIQSIQIFFLDGYVDDGTQNDPRTFVLELEIIDSQGNTYFYGADSGDGTYSFTNNDFSVTLTNSSGSTISLYSTNVSSQYTDELNGTVTFSVYDQNQNYIGQITGMHLYQ